jgi:hypothetical protein
MLGEIAQSRRCRAVGLEDGRVAEQDRDDDGQKDGDAPMPGCRRAVEAESGANRMVWP